MPDEAIGEVRIGNVVIPILEEALADDVVYIVAEDGESLRCALADMGIPATPAGAAKAAGEGEGDEGG